MLRIDDERIQSRCPVWRFSDFHDDGPWSFNGVAPKQVVNLVTKLGDYEKMTIGELFKPGSEHGKAYPTETLPDRASAVLRDAGRDDETEVVRLRLGGKPRLYGILREHVFYVLWYDPEHQVWPSEKS